MERNWKTRLGSLAILCSLLLARCGLSVAQTLPQTMTADSQTLPLAVCPIVYPLDQMPSQRGYHYLFYGNGFFINTDGYLLTAAHVLSQLNGAEPSIVLRLPMEPPRLLKATVVARDQEHDVALLKAFPNPFRGKYQVRFLPLAITPRKQAQPVVSDAFRPSRLKDPYTYDAFLEDRPSGEVVEYEFSQLEKGQPETELLLFSHDVLLGDSGAPVMSEDSQAVVGIVEGRWLRPAPASIAMTALPSNKGVAAAVTIHYAIALLQQNGVNWQEAQDPIARTKGPTRSTSPSLPEPLSLVAVPYPARALQGGEVILDAQIDERGLLSEVQTIQGVPPFSDVALDAVRTWSFRPGSTDADKHHSQPHIAIIVEFDSPGAFRGPAKARYYDGPQPDPGYRSARPLVTAEPNTVTADGAEVGVILAVRIDAHGEAQDVRVLQDPQSLADTVIATVRQWQFVPGRAAGQDQDSEAIVVVIPRAHPATGHK